MTKIIGTVTTYQGTEINYLKGSKVRIIAVLKNAAKLDIDVDGPEYQILSDDLDIERFGGVTAFDRIEVQPWIEKEGRFSFVSSDPKAVNLAFFQRLFVGAGE